MNSNAESTKVFQIAIDGYSSCGKSTLAKQLAEHLGIVYIDTGAMYRAFTLYCLQHNIDSTDTASIRLHIPKIHIELRNEKNTTKVILNGSDVSEEIRSMKVSNAVSSYSAHPEVRKALVSQQQELGMHQSVVLDGRDIGTTVFPNAKFKLFMTASEEVRVQRRFDELKAKNPSITYQEIKENIAKRDFEDINRTESPLLQAEDALVLDNSALSPDAQFQWVINQLKALNIIQ
jgi:CMP/dCMP kinase